MIPTRARPRATAVRSVLTLSAILCAATLIAGCGPAGSTGRPAVSSPGSSPPSARSAVPVTSSPALELAPFGTTETARVVRVVDGDTIVIDRGRGHERLRYIGINAPESVKPDTPVQFMGHEASVANTALVDGREVVLEKDVSEVDQYGRLLRYVWLRDGAGWIFVNLELARDGFAQAATYPPDVRWAMVFRTAEREARSAGAGLWSGATAAP